MTINIITSSVSKRYDMLPVMICEKTGDDFKILDRDLLDDNTENVWHHYFLDHPNSIRPNNKVALKWDNKIYQYENLSDIVDVPDFRVYENSFELIKDLNKWPMDIVITSEYGDGGESFLYFNKNMKPEDIYKKFTHQKIRVSEYLHDSISISAHIIIANKDVFFVSPTVRQYIRNRINYAGGIYPLKTVVDINPICRNISNRLFDDGYTGLCHIDFLVQDSNVFLCEINPRIAASTPLITYTLEQEYGINLPYLEYHAAKYQSLPFIPCKKKKNLEWDFIIFNGTIPDSSRYIQHMNLRTLFSMPDGEIHYLDMFNGRYAEVSVNDKRN